MIFVLSCQGSYACNASCCCSQQCFNPLVLIFPFIEMSLKPPPQNVYITLEDLIVAVNKHAGSQRYACVKCYLK